MSICTKRGDKGFTDCLYNHKAHKSEDLIDVIGTLDELNAWIGYAWAQEAKPQNYTSRELSAIYCNSDMVNQLHSLMVQMMGELSARPENYNRYVQDFKDVVHKDHIEMVERWIARAEEGKKFSDWNSPRSAWDVVCRIARRAERRLWSYSKLEPRVRKENLILLNRLSDLFWLWGRTN